MVNCDNRVCEVDIQWDNQTVKYKAGDRPYSLAVMNDGGYIFTAGVVPVYWVNDESKKVDGDLKRKVKFVLTVIEAILKKASGQDNVKDKILKTTVYVDCLTNDKYSKINDAYKEFFGDNGLFPARTVVEAPPPTGFEVEIEAVAYIPSEEG